MQLWFTKGEVLGSIPRTGKMFENVYNIRKLLLPWYLIAEKTTYEEQT